MISVSNRLLSIASFIDANSNVFDIGCDHGLLDVYLTLYKNCFCTAIDVNSNIISRARNSFIKYDVLDKISLVVGNGFNDLDIPYDSIIVLAGMGTSTILKILNKNRSKDIICQTNTDLYGLRKNVCDMGYYIESEDLVFDNMRYYVTIKFCVGSRKYSYEDYLLGPILRFSNSELFKTYVNKMYLKNIKGYNKAVIFNSDNLSEMKLFIDTLKRYI